MRPQGAADNKQPSSRFTSPVDDPPPQENKMQLEEQPFELDPHSLPPVDDPPPQENKMQLEEQPFELDPHSLPPVDDPPPQENKMQLEEQPFELDPHSPPPVLDSGTTKDKITQPEAMEDEEKPPSVLDINHFRRVKDLIHSEIEEKLLQIKDGDKDRPVNLMNDPVLNVVIACKKTKLAISLINKIKKMSPERLMNKNYFHDTALHVAASMDNVDVAEALIRANKDLVNELNKKQETPLHKAAQNGHRNMFWCLVINGGGSPAARRWDGATMLHCAIMGNAPGIPLEADYSQNRRKGDEEDAVNKSRNVIGWTRLFLFNILRPISYRIQSLERKKKKHKQAMELTAFLAQPQYMEFHESGKTGSDEGISSPNIQDVQQTKKDKDDANQQARRWNEPPLILGAQLGLHDFVKKILQVCPQSVAYLDTKNRSVVRVAIENGSKEIVHIIHKMARGDNPTLPSWLFSSVHQDSKNTILHLASEKCHTNEGDAVQMQDEMKWFEEVKDMIPKELVYSRNKDEKTAQEVFTESHKGMLEKCKEQLMEMGKTCSGLVAAVVFASSFSIPGEKDDKTGNPVYFHRLPFKIFSHAYVIGLSCAATSLVLFLSLVVCPYKEQQFRRAIPTKYLFACLSFAIALVAFLVSFACNMFLQIYGGQKTETKDLIVMILELTVFPIVSFLLLLYRGSNFFPSFFSRLT
ncbi:hypothetical protein Cni_G28346 [Canna indica]|uniref:PGG domain-containing protein n=1 Tax=Canna indica TaxID=4628 RepID=A0AAQ3QQ69_9LILI|nr:hypothetical protein Cni_G28346 [Canna indica]